MSDEFQPPTFHNIERPLPDYLKWGQIAFDIVLKTPPDLLMRMHGLARSQLVALIKEPRFANMVRETREALDKAGLKGTFKMRTALVAEELVEEMRRIAIHPLTDAKVKLSIFEAMTRHAEMDPSINKNKNEGVVVNFSFGSGMPGLSRLSNQPEAIEHG